jgi:hypothetical protein
MKLISWWGCGTIDQPLISGDKIVEFGIAEKSQLRESHSLNICYDVSDNSLERWLSGRKRQIANLLYGR